MEEYILYIPTALNENLYKFDRVLPGGLFTTILEKAGEVDSVHFDDILGRGTAEEVFKYYEAVVIEANGIQETLKSDDPELAPKLMNGANIIDLVYPTYKSPLEELGFNKIEENGIKTFTRGSVNKEIIRIENEVVTATYKSSETRPLSLTKQMLEAILKEVNLR